MFTLKNFELKIQLLLKLSIILDKLFFSIFSSTLMDMCLEESLTEKCPKKVLVRAIQKMQKIHESENHRLLGSSTAVTLALDKEQKR